MDNEPVATYSSSLDDAVFGNLNALNMALRGLDDRGLVLSIAAFSEEALGLLIKAFMRPNEAAHKLLEGFNAPLGTFSSRIKAAHALGLVTDDQFSDLEHFRKIRNAFAHSWRPLSFAHPSVSGHIDALNYGSLDDDFPETHWQKVRSSMSCLLMELTSAAEQINKNSTGARILGAQLIRGFSGDTDAQIAAARKHMDFIESSISTTTGKRQEFYTMLLKRLVHRIAAVAIPASKERQPEILAFISEVEKKSGYKLSDFYK